MLPTKATGAFNNLFAQPAAANLDPAVIEAVRKYNAPEHIQIIDDWLKKTTNKNAMVDAEGRNILHIAAMYGRQPKLIPFFIKKGLNVNAVTLNSDTPLMSAIKAYHDAEQEKNEKLKANLILVIKELLAAGAKNLPDEGAHQPKTAMTVAVNLLSIEVVQLLLDAKFDINECDYFSPLWYLINSELAKSEKVEAMIKFLRQHGALSLMTKNPALIPIAERLQLQLPSVEQMAALLVTVKKFKS